MSVTKRPGATVKAGEPIVTLDDRELVARVAQAKQAVESAIAAERRAEQSKAQGDARLRQATLRHERMQRLSSTQAVTPEAVEAAEADWLSATAALADAQALIAAAAAQREQAAQVVAEAELARAHAQIASPIDGVISERHVEPGDYAWPGRTLLVVLDPKAQRLEAHVREALLAKVTTGQTLDVIVPAADATTPGTVAEIVPSADPLSRTFTVRVDFGPVAAAHAGMFGRLRIPAGTREAVRVASAAVVRVGQLRTVVVKEGDRFERRPVTTGAEADGRVEILSGLRGGETVGLGGLGELPPESR
jgi:RND family efflux transporter MFP subunit